MKATVLTIAKGAKEASRKLAFIKSSIKNEALKAMAREIKRDKDNILRANRKDLALARRSGHKRSFIDRLRLDEARIIEMAKSLEEVARLSDPVGEVMERWRRPNGLKIAKVRVPIGVIAIIYESRPNVTADAAGLTLKSGNAVILRGGREAFYSNEAIKEILVRAGREAGIPEGSISTLPTTSHQAVAELLKLDRYLDLVIPRGGQGLIKTVCRLSRIPVIKHYKGLCHVYVDEGAEFKMAEKIIFNAKVQRPGVCNAMETLLVHQAMAQKFLPRIGRLLMNRGVELRGCPLTCKILPGLKKAREADWHTEYLDLILSVKVVEGITQAIEHINTYGSGLSEAIVTGSYSRARRFTEEIDSAVVYVNASTRFTDGHQFGLGAEVGISTDKIHARGPMGVKELTIYKYIVHGEGQVRI